MNSKFNLADSTYVNSTQNINLTHRNITGKCHLSVIIINVCHFRLSEKGWTKLDNRTSKYSNEDEYPDLTQYKLIVFITYSLV